MAFKSKFTPDGSGSITIANPELGDATGLDFSTAPAPDFGDGNSDSGIDGRTDGSSSGGSGGDDTVFDAERHISPDKRNADGSYRRKRARKGTANSASRKQRTSSDHKASVEGLTRILTILHVGLAAATKTPELELDEDEAANLAGATSQVLKEFNIQPDPKVEAVIGLVTAAGLIYGPRIYLIKQRLKKEGAARNNE